MITVTINQGLPKASPARVIRQAVFVEEQGFHNEFDDIDHIAYHVLLSVEGEPAATGRIYAQPDRPEVYIIGRMAVLPQFRSQRYGSMVMAALEEQAKRLGAKTLKLSAQLHAQGFYEKRGYKAYGEVYNDEHCPHIAMSKEV